MGACTFQTGIRAVKTDWPRSLQHGHSSRRHQERVFGEGKELVSPLRMIYLEFVNNFEHLYLQRRNPLRIILSHCCVELSPSPFLALKSLLCSCTTPLIFSGPSSSPKPATCTRFLIAKRKISLHSSRLPSTLPQFFENASPSTTQTHLAAPSLEILGDRLEKKKEKETLHSREGCI